MDLNKEIQQSAVASEYEALLAVIAPILKGVLYSIVRKSLIDQVGGYETISLELLSNFYHSGDGDCGICFEYAVHDAILHKNPAVMERLEEAMKHCNIRRDDASSILFGAEKSGVIQLIKSKLTEESVVLHGTKGQPPKLKRHIEKIAEAFRNKKAREKLPTNISGLWKADLFVGSRASDQWLGTTVKIHKHDLEPAKGLRIGITPSTWSKSDKVEVDEIKNLVICPLPYDKSFMEIFLRGWILVKALFDTKMKKMPSEIAVPMAADRFVCQELLRRKQFPVVGIIGEYIELNQQKELLETKVDSNAIDYLGEVDDVSSSSTGKIISPMPSIHKKKK